MDRVSTHRMTTDVGHVAAVSGEKVTSKVDTVAVVGTSANPSGFVGPCDVLLRSNVQVPSAERTPGVQSVELNAGPAARVPPRVGCQDSVIAHALISAMSAFTFVAPASSRNRKNGPEPARCKKLRLRCCPDALATGNPPLAGIRSSGVPPVLLA
jgi:hypothetical protein